MPSNISGIFELHSVCSSQESVTLPHLFFYFFVDTVGNFLFFTNSFLAFSEPVVSWFSPFLADHFFGLFDRLLCHFFSPLFSLCRWRHPFPELSTTPICYRKIWDLGFNDPLTCLSSCFCLLKNYPLTEQLRHNVVINLPVSCSWPFPLTVSLYYKFSIVFT